MFKFYVNVFLENLFLSALLQLTEKEGDANDEHAQMETGGKKESENEPPSKRQHGIII